MILSATHSQWVGSHDLVTPFYLGTNRRPRGEWGLAAVQCQTMEKYATSPWSCCKNVGYFQYPLKDIYHSVLSLKKKWRAYHSLVNVSLKFQLARLQDESVGSILGWQHIYESVEVWTDESFFFPLWVWWMFVWLNYHWKLNIVVLCLVILSRPSQNIILFIILFIFIHLFYC